MADFLRAYAVDEKKATEGVWDTLPSGVEVCVARQGNAEFNSRIAAAMATRQAALQRAKESGDEDTENRLIDEAWAEGLAGGVLTNWRNLEIGGREIPFSVEAATRLLAFREFRTEIVVLAKRKDRFRPDDLDALGEELGNTLPGNSPTEES